jgi:hypothetical protein
MTDICFLQRAAPVPIYSLFMSLSFPTFDEEIVTKLFCIVIGLSGANAA